MKTVFYKVFCYLSLSLFGFPSITFAHSNPPKISIIIDDLGYDERAGLQVANLPGAVVCSVLPDVEFSKELAVKCHERQKEIILHAPMEALAPHHLGPGGLLMSMDKKQFLATLNADLNAVPFIDGLNNHEGSRLTAAPLPMQWLMQAIKGRGLIFIDSATSPHSVAEKTALANNIPTTKRDVFLDNIPTEKAVREQLELLLDEADSKGQAVAIGHPYAATLRVLQEELPKLIAQGYVLVPVAQMTVQIGPVPDHAIQLPFLQQAWRQITAGQALFNPALIIQAPVAVN